MKIGTREHFNCRYFFHFGRVFSNPSDCCDFIARCKPFGMDTNPLTFVRASSVGLRLCIKLRALQVVLLCGGCKWKPYQITRFYIRTYVCSCIPNQSQSRCSKVKRVQIQRISSVDTVQGTFVHWVILILTFVDCSQFKGKHIRLERKWFCL